MVYDITKYSPGSGRRIKEDGTTVNIADLIESYIGGAHYNLLSTDALPTIEADQQATLWHVNTAKGYVHYNGSWYSVDDGSILA